MYRLMCVLYTHNVISCLYMNNHQNRGTLNMDTRYRTLLKALDKLYSITNGPSFVRCIHIITRIYQILIELCSHPNRRKGAHIVLVRIPSASAPVSRSAQWFWRRRLFEGFCFTTHWRGGDQNQMTSTS